MGHLLLAIPGKLVSTLLPLSPPTHHSTFGACFHIVLAPITLSIKDKRRNYLIHILGSKEWCVFNLLQVLFPDMGCAPCRASRDASHTWHATSQLPRGSGLKYALRELELQPPE